MEPKAIVIPPGGGHANGNMEVLARTTDTPRFNFSIIESPPGHEVPTHVHDEEDDAFYVLEGELTFVHAGEEAVVGPGTFVLVPPGVEHSFRNDTTEPARFINVHAPAGFDRRMGLES